MTKNSTTGIRVFVQENKINEIFADIDGPESTPYQDGVFRIKLVLTHDFPSSPPNGYFMTKIFHPNVNWSTGEICVNVLKKDWNANLGIKHILTVIRCLLIEPNAESALNENAGKLLLEEYDEYYSRAQLHTKIHAKTRNINEKENKNNFEEKKEKKIKKKGVKKSLKRL